MAGTSRKRQNTEYARKETAAKDRAAKSASGRAASGKKTASSGRAKSRRAKEIQEEESGFMGTEVAIIAAFAVSVLLFLSNFGICGAAGDFFRQALLGIFGTIGYIAPVLLFAGTCFYLSNRGNVRAVVKMAAVGAVLLALCGLMQLLTGGGLHEGWNPLAYYAHSGESGDGGGLLGGLLVMALCGALGTAGAYLVLFFLLIIGAVCITERSLVGLVRTGSGKAYEYAREDIHRRRELHEERREEQRRLREEQRVRGVNLDAVNLTETPLMREFAAGAPGGAQLPRKEETPGEDHAFRENGAFRENDALREGSTLREEGAMREDGASRGSGTSRNRADVFCGQIQMPEGMAGRDQAPEEDAQPEAVQREEASARASEQESERTGSAKERPEDEAEETDRDRLLRQLYIRRDTRTVEELSGVERQTAGRAEYSSETVQVAGRAEDGFDMARTAVPAEEGPDTEEERFAGMIHTSAAGAEASMTVEEDEPGGAAGFSDEDLQPLEAYERTVGPDGGYYKTTETADGENDDRFFVPEDPEPVVTASGKIIDTGDAEAVRRKMEKRREERRSAPEEELTVSEQIGKRAEEEKKQKKEYVFPPLSLLTRGSGQTTFSEKECRETAIKLQQTLQNFGVGVTVTNVSCGPSVTRYELHPEQGVKVSRIVALADDIKLNLAAADIRIEAPIPGKAAVGIEVPNKENNVVHLRDLLESDAFRRFPSKLAFAVGKDIAGQAVVGDIAKMPHVLIAGATGSGKSVCINTLILSLIYKARPEEVKLIMIDPKVVELSIYNGIPHMLIPVVTDPKKASGALNWAVTEMTERYQRFARYNVRDLKGYNAKVDSIADLEDADKPQKLPQVVIIIDELADLMMVAPGEVEDAICRLAQLARAAGIHLVVATQRPSVNVITGVIKANIPSRIAFAAASGADSRTIIDMNGAEKLLGKGDMLFYPSGYQKPQRVQGAFVSDGEILAVTEFLKEQGMEASYSEEVASRVNASSAPEAGGAGAERDAYFVQAGRFIIEKDKASIGMLQRMFKIGFNRAARIMAQLAEAGVVGEEEGTKPRKILMTMEQFESMLEE